MMYKPVVLEPRGKDAFTQVSEAVLSVFAFMLGDSRVRGVKETEREREKQRGGKDRFTGVSDSAVCLWHLAGSVSVFNNMLTLLSLSHCWQCVCL